MKENIAMANYQEYWLEKSVIELDRDRTGLFSNKEQIDIIQFDEPRFGAKIASSDPLDKENIHGELVNYFYFVLDNKATKYSKSHYTLMNLFEE